MATDKRGNEYEPTVMQEARVPVVDRAKCKKEYDESMFLYNWWTKTRKEEYEAIDFAYLQTKLFDSKNMPPEYLSSSKSDYESVMDNWLNLVREQEKKDD